MNVRTHKQIDDMAQEFETGLMEDLDPEDVQRMGRELARWQVDYPRAFRALPGVAKTLLGAISGAFEFVEEMERLRLEEDREEAARAAQGGGGVG